MKRDPQSGLWLPPPPGLVGPNLRRAPRRLGLGLGMGVGSQMVWHPSALGAKLFSYHDPALGLTIAADPALQDGTMEVATVTPPWTVTRAGIAKDSSIKYGGSQSMRLYENGAGDPLVYQTLLTVGQRIRCAAMARGDDLFGKVLAGDYALGDRFWASTVASSWQAMTGEATVAHANFSMGNVSNVGAQAWVDNVVLTNLSITAWADQSGHAHHYAQATAANQPWDSDTYGHQLVTMDGTADFIKSSEAASVWKFLHNGSGMTIVVAWWSDSGASGTNIMADTLLSGVTAPAISLQHDATNKQVAFAIGGVGSAAVLKYSGANSALTNRGHVVSMRHDEAFTPQVTCRLNGVDVYRGVRDGGAPQSGDPIITLTLGSYATGGLYLLKGGVGRIVICNDAMTDAELRCAELWCAASVGVTL